MRSKVTILAAAVVGIALVAFAPRLLSRSAEPVSPRLPPRAAAASPSSAVAEPGEKSLIGVIEKYDSATRQLTVNLGKTLLAFHVPVNAVVRQGSRRLKVEELSTHHGIRVKLRYSESSGQRRADWIMLAPPARQPKPARSDTPQSAKEPVK